MKIEYVHKMGKENKFPTTFDENEIPENIKKIIVDNEAFSASQDFGQMGLGKPDEIEILSIISDDGQKKEFKYYNKAIHYMMSGGEKERPIFQVFTHFMINERS